MKILLTGFDQFGGARTNSSYEAVRAVTAPEGVELIKMKVPTVFGTSLEIVRRTARAAKPDAVLMTGQAGGSVRIAVERTAINLEDAPFPDNDGKQPTDMPVFKNAPAAFFSTLPVKQIADAIRAAGIPASISDSAGTFVCNHLMYGMLYYAGQDFPGMRCGFIHVPCTPDQAARIPENISRIIPVSAMPSMSVSAIVHALETALTVIRDTQ